MLKKLRKRKKRRDVMSEKLSRYNDKRNFERTLEPEGTQLDGKEVLRFVVQHHMARRNHYDFRLEWDGVLLSFAVPKGPSYDTHDKRLAIHVEDHPIEYRNFEGMIPKGEYGGGTVMIWDEGYWEPGGSVDEGLNAGMLKFVLKGRRLKGKWALVRLKKKENEAKDNWLLLKEKDKYVKEEDGISQFSTSIRTGRTMKEIEEGEDEKFIKNPFKETDVQLAKLVTEIPEGEDWLYEMKYDGYRILSFIEGNTVRLATRNGNDYTGRFQEVAHSLLELAGERAMVLDGEMAVIDSSGKTDFGALQNYRKSQKGSLTYIIFDLLALDGEDLREHKLTDRKEKLEELMKDAPPHLYYSRHVTGKGKESFDAANAAGMEGIMGKRMDSVYSGTRNGDWIKMKCYKRQEFVIGGFSLSNKKTRGVSSLLLGVYEEEKLVYVGRVGTGFNDQDMEYLLKKFESIISTESPFQSVPPAKAGEKVTWLRPELVAEVSFAGWTKENLLRQASYKGLRSDKEPGEIIIEKPEDEVISQPIEKEGKRPMEAAVSDIIIEGIKITSPDKVMFSEPDITKEDVIRYYEEVSMRMLPYVSQRLLSVVRCPGGIFQTSFFKKHPAGEGKGIIVIPVSDDKGKTEDYFYIENISGLIYEAQMNTLEFHTWGSRADNLEKPDMMVFDLDPDEGMDLYRVRQGVRDVRSILNDLSLKSYLKTSGGKGYHVVVPLKPSGSWEVVHDFSQNVAKVMEKKWPDRYTSNVRKAKRTNKIFIDWIRNGRGATSVAPYSIRARIGAKVSMPVSWDELDMVAPDGINMAEALRRIEGNDPWDGFFQNNQQIK